MTTETDPRVAEAMWHLPPNLPTHAGRLEPEPGHRFGAIYYTPQQMREYAAQAVVAALDAKVPSAPDDHPPSRLCDCAACTPHFTQPCGMGSSAPVEAVAWEWRIDGGNWIPCNESGAKHFAKQPGCEWRALGVIAPASAPVEAVPILSEEWLRNARAEVRSLPECEHTVWWILLVRRVENEIGAGYRRLHAACEDQKGELLRTWDVLKEFGRHPGRTDDRLADCVKSALATTAEPDETARLTEELVDEKAVVDCLRSELADRLQKQRSAEAELQEVRKDADRLDHLQDSGATVDLVPMAGEHPHGFRIGGLHKTVSHNLRKAIDIALEVTNGRPE